MEYYLILAVLVGALAWLWRRGRPLRIRIVKSTTVSGGGVVTGYYKDAPVHIVRRVHSLRHMSPALGKRAIRRRNLNRAEGESCRFA